MIVEITIRSTVIKNQKVQTYTKLCEIGGGDPAHSLFRLSPPTIIRLSPPTTLQIFQNRIFYPPLMSKFCYPLPPSFWPTNPLIFILTVPTHKSLFLSYSIPMIYSVSWGKWHMPWQGNIFGMSQRKTNWLISQIGFSSIKIFGMRKSPPPPPIPLSRKFYIPLLDPKHSKGGRGGDAMGRAIFWEKGD